MFLGSNAIEQGAAGKERRLGGWFRRRLNLSTEQVISAMFSTVDWLGDAALAWQTSQNRQGSYNPSADQTVGCLDELIATARVTHDHATSSTAALEWTDSAVALRDAASFGMTCPQTATRAKWPRHSRPRSTNARVSGRYRRRPGCRGCSGVARSLGSSPTASRRTC